VYKRQEYAQLYICVHPVARVYPHAKA
jgi:hypothetical protein